jgi:hypothetical protein
MTDRYFLQLLAGGEPTEVTQEQFILAERNAGFHPKRGCGPVATGGFSNGTIRGIVRYEPDSEPPHTPEG